MSKKYLASIFKESKVGENDYIYSTDKVVVGTIDEKTRIFTDHLGVQYKPISTSEQYKDIENYYGNSIETEKLVQAYGGKYTYSFAVMAHDKRCREVLFYKVKEDEKYIIIPIDKRPYLNMVNDIKQAFSEPSDKRKPEEENDPFIEALQHLVERIAIGNYSVDELLDLQKMILAERNEVDGVLEAIDLKLETLKDEEKSYLKNKGEETTHQDTTPKEENKAPSNVLDQIDITETFNKVTKTLIAQDEPARRVIVELSRLDEMRKKDYGILLTGDSGVGKTLLMSLIAKYMNRPLLKIDSTQLTAPGYVGRDIEQYLWDLYISCNKDLEKAERAIVFFDEIDKKGSEKKSDISGQAVLNSLLTFIGGTSYIATNNPRTIDEHNSIKIDTTNMIVVAGGAFLDVYDSLKEKSIGFNNSNNNSEHREPEISDFINKSMIPKELMGRLPVIIKLNSLDVDSIKRILLESDESILKQQEEIFDKRGVKLTTQDGYIISAAQEAIDRKIGARGLNKIITDSTWMAYEDVSTHPGEYEEIILTDETVSNPKKYIKKPRINKQ